MLADNGSYWLITGAFVYNDLKLVHNSTSCLLVRVVVCKLEGLIVVHKLAQSVGFQHILTSAAGNTFCYGDDTDGKLVMDC